MLHFAIIAHDEYWIARCTRGDEIRMIYQIKRYMKDLEFLTARTVTFDYIRAIHKQSSRVKQAIASGERQPYSWLSRSNTG